MSHLHLPDGIIGAPWWIAGLIISIAFLFFAVYRVKKEDLSRKTPLIGTVAALMLVTMSIPLGILPFHINLTVLAGILAGPWLGYIAVFIVNLVLALIAHGGITTVGLNIIVIGSEVIIGYYLFQALQKRFKPVASVAITVVITLILSTSLMVGIITTSGVDLTYALPSEHEHEEVVEVMAQNSGAEVIHEAEFYEELEEITLLSLTGWGAVASIFVLGIAIEALAIALVVRYFLKVRPEFIMGISDTELDEQRKLI